MREILCPIHTADATRLDSVYWALCSMHLRDVSSALGLNVFCVYGGGGVGSAPSE